MHRAREGIINRIVDCLPINIFAVGEFFQIVTLAQQNFTHSCGSLACWRGERNFNISLACFETFDELHCNFTGLAGARATKNDVNVLSNIASQRISNSALFGICAIEVDASAINN